jgi:hypothetical protein
VPQDVTPLLAFVLHGLELRTRTGERIAVVAHLLRHVLSEHAIHLRHVPAEVVAHFFLHHRLLPPATDGSRRIPSATAYYGQKPQEMALAEAADLLTAIDYRPEDVAVPLPAQLASMEARLQAVYRQWGTIGPTTFGHCSAGLCVRGINRSQCLGCAFLVPHYRNLPSVAAWRTIYRQVLAQHRDNGLASEVAEAQTNLQHLDDLEAIMQIQLYRLRDGADMHEVDRLLTRGVDVEGGDL